jgi:hypothetical protein
MKVNKIIAAVEAVTARWAKQRKAEERRRAAINNRRDAMMRFSRVTVKSAAWSAMEAAYLKASSNGTLPAHARQIMYAARPYILEATGKETLDDKYFTQGLLPDYIEAHQAQCANWNVVFDARGHFHEPHTLRGVPLGTMEIRYYLKRISSHIVAKPSFDVREMRYPTFGPAHRYGAILFIEKEGFIPLFNAVRLAERYDIAIMSTKGMSVTASRKLVDTLCCNHNIPLLVLHDFDKSGFSIVGTLKRDTRRYTFENAIKVIDLGMRLADIDGLQREPANIEETAKSAAKLNLKENGATPEEIEFLLERRVELNAYTSDALVSWIEGKLAEHGVEKVIPDDETLAAAYRRASEYAAVQKMIDEAVGELRKRIGSSATPDNLRKLIADRLSEDNKRPWDEIVIDLAEKAAR